MPVSVLVFYSRRPDFTPIQFKAYMEDSHVPLIKEVMGPHYPLKHTLRYVERVDSGAGDRLGAATASKKRADGDAPVVLVGSPDDLEWDAVCEMTFRDELQLQQGLAAINSPEGQRCLWVSAELYDTAQPSESFPLFKCDDGRLDRYMHEVAKVCDGLRCSKGLEAYQEIPEDWRCHCPVHRLRYFERHARLGR